MCAQSRRDARAAGRQPGDAAQGLGATDGAAVAARRGSLCSALTPFEGFERARQGQPLAVGQRQRVGDAAIDSDARADIGGRDMLNLASEADAPAQSVERHRRVLERPAQGPRVAELDPADLGQARGRIFAAELPDFDLAALEAEAVVDASPARGRVFAATGEEVGVGFVEVAQSLLLAGLRHGGDPVVLGAQRGQLARLGDIVQPLPGLTPVLPPEVATLLKRQIVDQAADARELPQQDFLFGSRGKLVAEAAKDHSVAIGPRLDTLGANIDIRKGRHVVYALHAHLVFVTKYRRDALSELAIGDLRPVFAKVCKDFEAELIECDGEDDHVHLLIVYPPQVALSKLVNSLKGVSSRL